MADVDVSSPSTSTPAGSGDSGFSLSSVDSFLGASEPSESGDGAEGTEGAESTELPGAEGETDTSLEAADEAEQVDGAEGADDWDSDIGKPEIVEGPDGKPRHQYTEVQSRALQTAARFAGELHQAIPDLTVDDAIAHNEAYTDLSRMAHDMRRGTPDSVVRFTNTMLNEAGNGPFVANLAGSLLNHLRTANVPAYEKVKAGVETEIESEIIGMAKKVANHPDKNIRDGYTQLAKLLYFHFHNGDELDLEQHGAVDPLAEREKSIKAREDAIEQQNRQAQEQRQTSWTKAVTGEASKSLRSEIEKAIEPHKARFGKTPELVNMLVGHVAQQVRGALKADSEWSERFNIAYESASGELTRESAKRVLDSYVARVRSILKTQLPKMLSSASNGAVAQNAARRKQLERASAPTHRVPGATGAPASQSIAMPAKKFKTPDDYSKHLDGLLTT